MLQIVTLTLALLLSLPAMAQTADEAAANRLFVEAVESWRKAESLAGEDLSKIQESLRALRVVDANLRRIVEQHKSSSLAVKLVSGDRVGPLSLADTKKAIETAQHQEREALLRALEAAADRGSRALDIPIPPRQSPSTPTAATSSLPTTTAPTTPSPASALAPSAAEVSFWETVRNTRDPAELEAYLNAFPQGAFVPLARSRLQSLRPPQQVTASQPVQRSLPDPPSEQDAENRLWLQLRESRSISDLKAYLARNPRGPFADLVLARIEELQRAAQPQGGIDTIAAQRASGSPPSPLVPGRVFRDCSDCPEMLAVPQGHFVMGASSEEDELEGVGRQFKGWSSPQVNVRIDLSLAIGRLEVTRGEFASFVRETGHVAGNSCRVWDGSKWAERVGASWRSPGFTQNDRHPVVCVSWDDAQAYVRWLSARTGKDYRLLSEAQWEYAARAGSQARRPWGDNAEAGCAHANIADAAARRQVGGITWGTSCDDGHGYTAETGTYQANRFGLHDMIGNVWEWTADCWNPSLAGVPADGSARATGDCSRRVFRGGSWFEFPRYARSALRSSYSSDYRSVFIGFRVARTL